MRKETTLAPPRAINSDLLIYQTTDGAIKIDVRVADDTVWLSLNQLAELFRREKSVISRHIKNVFDEGELHPEETVAKSATVQAEGGNGRELLTHAGKISHQMALDKAMQEYDKYRETQRQIQHEESLKELEQDLRQLHVPNGGENLT